MIKAVIPIKLLSTGLKNKTILHLAGREMWEWVTIAAVDSEIDNIYMCGNATEKKFFFDKKVKILYPSIKWITRPAALQKNGVEILDTMKYCQKKIGKSGDIFIQLQTTKPMTSAVLINDCIDTFIDNKCNSLFTVKEILTSVNWAYTPSRQAAKRINFQSCAAVKIWDYKTLANAKIGTWGFGNKHFDYTIPARHIEIDTYEDFLIAEAMKNAGL